MGGWLGGTWLPPGWYLEGRLPIGGRKSFTMVYLPPWVEYLVTSLWAGYEAATGLGEMMSWMFPAFGGTLIPGIFTPGWRGGGRWMAGRSSSKSNPLWL